MKYIFQKIGRFGKEKKKFIVIVPRTPKHISYYLGLEIVSDDMSDYGP